MTASDSFSDAVAGSNVAFSDSGSADKACGGPVEVLGGPVEDVVVGHREAVDEGTLVDKVVSGVFYVYTAERDVFQKLVEHDHSAGIVLVYIAVTPNKNQGTGVKHGQFIQT